MSEELNKVAVEEQEQTAAQATEEQTPAQATEEQAPAQATETPEQAPIKEPEQAESPEAAEEAPKKASKMSNASADNATFDWDAFEKEDFYDADKAAIEEKYSQTLSRVNENEVVEGVVVAKDKREVVVNIGYKSEGVINISEFRYNPNLEIGDTVEVFV